MSAVNPYQAPGAAVADVTDPAVGFSTPKVFSAAGRLGRLRYLAYCMVGYLIVILVAGLVGGVLGFSGSPEIAGIVGVLVAIPYGVLTIMWLIQRSHDMGWSGWTVLLCFIPLVALIWMFKPGTPGANKYGAPPPPNGTGIYIAALLLPIIAVIGILAAIALPAYDTYTKKARAAQEAAQQQQAPAPAELPKD